MIQIKTDAEIALMRAAGLVVGRTLEALRGRGRAGRHDRRAGRDRRGVDPRGRRGPVVQGLPAALPAVPGSICASVNDEIVHGIPGRRVLRDGDLISIDCGAILDGWHGDAAVTVRGRRGRPTRSAS